MKELADDIQKKPEWGGENPKKYVEKFKNSCDIFSKETKSKFLESEKLFKDFEEETNKHEQKLKEVCSRNKSVRICS